MQINSRVVAAATVGYRLERTGLGEISSLLEMMFLRKVDRFGNERPFRSRMLTAGSTT